MQVPLTVSFKGVPVSEAVRTACWNEAEKLQRYYDRITSCHVTVALPQRHTKGNHFAIHVRLAVPGGDVVVDHTPPQHASDEDPQLAVRDAFDETRRQLQDHVHRLRERARQHERAAPGSGGGPGPM